MLDFEKKLLYVKKAQNSYKLANLKKHDIINCTEQELIYTNWISEWPQNSPKINNT